MNELMKNQSLISVVLNKIHKSID